MLGLPVFPSAKGDSMQTKLIRVSTENGLHLRIAARIVELCKRYKSTEGRVIRELPEMFTDGAGI